MRLNIKPEDYNQKAVIDTYGSFEAFEKHIVYSNKKSKHRKFLIAVRTMIQVKSCQKGIRLYQKRFNLLIEDNELMTYFQSVDEHGEECWKDEEIRVRKRMQELFPKPVLSKQQLKKATSDGAGNLSLEAINDLLETWRSWGKLLLLYRA